MKKKNVSFLLNGEPVNVTVADNERLVDTLRNQLHLTGTKKSCERGDCGACTVLINKKAVNSCLVLTVTVEGKEIQTIEGLNNGEQLDPVQEAFCQEGAAQCGFCTPGMIMSAKALLEKNNLPTDEEIKEALAGNLCRCTGYEDPIKAVKRAAQIIKNNQGS